MTISTNEMISAIYYALWQDGYEYADLERDAAHMAALTKFAKGKPYPFFAQTRQNTCEVYPYWPRAALLETASFHVTADCPVFCDFAGLHRKIMDMPNVVDTERDEHFWAWLAGFPSALHEVLHSVGFRRYLEWESAWIDEQNILHQDELKRIAQCVKICTEKYHSPVKQLQIVINPVKCVYSADYHLNGDTFIFCSGRLREASVIHEFLHHVVHPVVGQHQARILADDRMYPGIDASYYAAGRLNAFEEHLVRVLTQHAMQDALPDDLPAFLHTLL